MDDKWGPWEMQQPASLWNRISLIHGSRSTRHDDVIKWNHFPRYWPFVRGIHRPSVDSPHIGQWRGALVFSFICAWINGWVNNREAGDLRRFRTHYDVIVMENRAVFIVDLHLRNYVRYGRNPPRAQNFYKLYSLAPGRCDCNLNFIISKLMSTTNILGISVKLPWGECHKIV